jgi:histidine triad (HIT) family protein
MSDCIFCKIVAGEIPAQESYRDDDVIAIADVNPQAPKHLLVLPRKHYATIAQIVESGDHRVAGSLVRVAAQMGREIGERGFRLVVNTGEEGGQTVDHVHVHVLAGRQMHWPPG